MPIIFIFNKNIPSFILIGEWKIPPQKLVHSKMLVIKLLPSITAPWKIMLHKITREKYYDEFLHLAIEGFKSHSFTSLNIIL